MVTSRISRYAMCSVLRSAHMGRVYVHVFIMVTVHACYERVLCNSKKIVAAG
jgi:hypothetical protein